MSLGKQIKKAAIDAEMTLTEVRTRAHISPKHFSRIVNDEADPSASIVRRICMALGVSADQLLELDTNSLSEAQKEGKGHAGAIGSRV